MHPATWLVDNVPVPDPALRAVIRTRMARKVRHEARGGPAALHERKTALLERRANGPVTTHVGDANRQHYEVPTEFFERILGPARKYSCCLWERGVADLAAAEQASLDQVVERAELADGQRILELGCGWGSFALHAARRFPGSEVVAVSNSATQRAHIDAVAAEEGLANLTVVTADIADFQPDGDVDRVVSIEMFEHVANHRLLLRRISGWLRADGRCFVHVFSHDRVAWEFDADDPGDWMARHFFAGGIMPSDDLLLHEQRDLAVIRHWRLDGRHYERTLLAWLERLDADRDGCLRALAAGEDTTDAVVQLRRWRTFLLASAGCWGFRGGREFGVSHYLFAPRPVRGERPA
jgi:cyclopropane-fatty-acyl-phospholipid synthase